MPVRRVLRGRREWLHQGSQRAVRTARVNPQPREKMRKVAKARTSNKTNLRGRGRERKSTSPSPYSTRAHQTAQLEICSWSVTRLPSSQCHYYNNRQLTRYSLPTESVYRLHSQQIKLFT